MGLSLSHQMRERCENLNGCMHLYKFPFIVILWLLFCHYRCESYQVKNRFGPLIISCSQAVEELLIELDLDKKSIVLGSSKVGVYSVIK